MAQQVSVEFVQELMKESENGFKNICNNIIENKYLLLEIEKCLDLLFKENKIIKEELKSLKTLIKSNANSNKKTN